MEGFQALANGFGTALTPENLMFAFLGCLMGTMIGVLPGIGTIGGTALLVPITFQLPPTGAIIMLSAIYYGAMYGGTITSVLINLPGESTSVVTCFDGYEMAKKGRAGVALSMAAIGSFIGGTLATFGLAIAAMPLSRMALSFGPPETFALMVLGLTLLMGLSSESLVKGLTMGAFGMLLAMIGMEPAEGVARFTFGRDELLSGLSFVPVVMGLFGVAEIFLAVEVRLRPVINTTMSSLIPTRRDVKDSGWPIARGTGLGFVLGLIPGMSPTLTTFVAYIMEKRLSKYPEKFGTGVIEGVVGPETANNSHANAALIPLFTLGIPPTATLAVLMGAFMMNGLIPGPLLFVEHPDVVWAVIASLYIGNVILLILNLPLIGLWVRALQVPPALLYPLILAVTLVGSYSVNSNVFDLGLMVIFGVLGYLFKKLDYPLAPVILTVVLGPLMEKALRASLQMSGGNIMILYTRPLSALLLILSVLFLLSFALPFVSGTLRTAQKKSS